MVADPIFEIVRLPDREEFRFEIGQQAQDRADDAQLDERFESAQRIGEEFAVIINPRGTRAHQHVVRQNLGPEILDRFRLREEAVAADIEVKTLVGRRSGDAADVDRVGLEHSDGHVVLGKKIRRRQSSRSRTYDRYIRFHSFKLPSCPS